MGGGARGGGRPPSTLIYEHSLLLLFLLQSVRHAHLSSASGLRPRSAFYSLFCFISTQFDGKIALFFFSVLPREVKYAYM